MYCSVLVKEIYFTFVVSSAATLVGIGYGFPAQVIPDLLNSNDMPVDKNGLSWIATAGLIFRPIGALMDLLLIDLLGRRSMLRAMAFTSVIGWTIVTFSTTELILCIGRAITSFGVGMVAAPLTYITEMCELKHRATLLQISCSSILLGTEVIYMLNTLFHWRIASRIVAVYSAIFLLTLYTIPESYQWYLIRNRTSEAKISYKWSKNCNDEFAEEKIQQEISNSKVMNNKEDKSIIENLKSPTVYKPMILLLIIHMLRMGLGAEVFSGYAVQMISQLHIPYEINTIVDVFGFLSFVFAYFTCYLIHKFKKRTLLMFLACVMLLSIAYVIVNLELPRKDKFVPFPYVQMCFFTFYMLIASITQQICFGVIPELFSLNCRGTMFGIVALFIFAVVTLYTHLYGELSMRVRFTWFLYFATLNGVLFLFAVLFFLPETKNVPLSEIEKYFSKKSKDTSRTDTIMVEMQTNANNGNGVQIA